MNNIATTQNKAVDEAETPSKREQEVLDAVLDLMVEEGGQFSMASVARRASCSKETLYRWFDDRDGLLTETVRWQASKVGMPKLDDEKIDRALFVETLQKFAESWLSVITGDMSIALNGQAILHAANRETRLGQIVLENGPLAMKRRLQPIFKLGNRAHIINVPEEVAFRTFFGLVLADSQIRVLLGEDREVHRRNIKSHSVQAVDQFMALFGTTNSNQTGE